ncbi:hypothetical protein ZEAMMB73_Zm00001d007748 [Zea mays]|uniref:Uncharacterized protein n=1 Tax=Zea mays TaxID=4577 RepID=A0A1D6F8J0_MAIZE|nr:hypothetical protein ZEAMMB73_Zm00001d007748 [Zea mays]
MVKLKESMRLTLELYLSVACQSMLAGQTSNTWKMLHSKSMSRLVGVTRFLSEPLHIMVYPLSLKSQQSSLAYMSHTPHQERTLHHPLLLLVSS